MIKNPKKFIPAAVAAVIIAIIASILGMAISNSSIPEAKGENDASVVMERINSAEEIFAKKALFTFGDKWTIYADGEEVGTVHGEYIKGLGDFYSLYSTNGHFVGAEEENFVLVGAKARMFDMNKNEVGTVTRQVFSLMQKFDIAHDGKTVGTLKQKVDLGLSANIVTPDDTVAWKISRKKISIGAKVTIKFAAESEITGMDALWAGLISNEIYEAESKAQNNTNSKR